MSNVVTDPLKGPDGEPLFPVNRAQRGGGRAADIESSLIRRISQGLVYAATGNRPEIWFGPGEPIAPVVPYVERPTVEGRQFDYPVATNTNIQPKQTEGITFATLRALADNYDLLRLVLETRKDQVENLRFNIVYKDDTKDPDDRCKEIEAFFQLPDKEHTWHEWVRMLVEDMLVIDAATVYPRLTRGGDLYALEPVDGATIKRLLDATGRTPLPPDPAYQQILKGVPAADYQLGELLYKPRNMRTNRIYGFSPVEQIIMTVNIALNRQLSQLQFYTEGSSADLVFGMPASWNISQVAQFQAYWDTLLAGNTAERRRTKFIPGDVKPLNTKDIKLMDEYDEWLARIVCFCFSVPPTAFTKQTNRSTSETMMQQAKEEGLQPIMQWLKNLHDQIVLQFWGPEFELSWADDESIDPLVQAQIDQIYLREGVVMDDEVRVDLGLPPLTAEQRAQKAPPPQLAGAVADDGTSAKDKLEGKDKNDELDMSAGGGAAQKAKKHQSPAELPWVKPAVGSMQKTLEHFLHDWGKKAAHNLHQVSWGKAGKDRQVEDALDDLPWDEFDDLALDTVDLYTSVAVASGDNALKELGLDDTDMMAALRQNGVDFARDRSAELVGKKWVDGELVDNPSAEWAITEETRDALRDLLTKATEEGWDGQTVANAIEEDFAFSPERSEMIARTEMCFTDISSKQEGWKQSGVVWGQRWSAAPDCCDECQALDGEEVELGSDFPNDGGSGPPLHPRCVCDVVAVLTNKSEED